VVASRIGGIQEQIVHGETGILLDDPRDLAAFGAQIARLLANPDEAQRMGRRARERVRDRFTTVRNLLDYVALIKRLIDRTPGGRRAEPDLPEAGGAIAAEASVRR
jgi:trehalose synthase